MQKIRCPRCGVVNLEKFVTFPQCAGCGSTLAAESEAALPFWKRPLGSLWWVGVIGGAIVLLLTVASFFTALPENEARLLIYGNASRRIELRQTAVITMTLDALAETAAQRRAPLRNVKVRLPRKLFKSLAFVSLDPKPDMLSSTAGGRYFHYQSLPRESVLQLRLYAVAAGKHRVRADVYVDDHLPADFSFWVVVSPPDGGK